MTTRFVLRVLDNEQKLLAWSDVWAYPWPGGRFVAQGPVQMAVEASGRPTTVVIQWPDLDIARSESYLGEEVWQQGQVATWHPFGALWRIQGEENVPLPAVTVRRSVTLTVPVRDLGVTP